jgi:hypothetical protein
MASLATQHLLKSSPHLHIIEIMSDDGYPGDDWPITHALREHAPMTQLPGNKDEECLSAPSRSRQSNNCVLDLSFREARPGNSVLVREFSKPVTCPMAWCSWLSHQSMQIKATKRMTQGNSWCTDWMLRWCAWSHTRCARVADAKLSSSCVFEWEEAPLHHRISPAPGVSCSEASTAGSLQQCHNSDQSVIKKRHRSRKKWTYLKDWDR